MIVCTECGHGNEADDAFCGSCGAFLEFSGEAIVPDPPVVTQDVGDDAAAEAGPGIVGRIKTAVGLEDHADEDDAGEEIAAVAAVAEAQAEVDAATERARREAEIARAKAADEAEARRKAEKAAADAAAEAEEVKARAEAEASALRKAEETARAQAAAEAAQARAAAEAEADRLRAEAEASRVKAEQAAVQAAAREAEARAESEAESARLRAEAEESRRQAEAAIAEAEERAAENKRRAEEDAERARAEVEAARAEAEAAKAAAEAEAMARAAAEAAEAAARQAAEEARLRTEAEAAAREAAEAAAEQARQEEEKRKAELAERANAMVVTTVVEPVEAAPDPDLGPTLPVRETRKRKRVPVTPVITREPKPGDLICGKCGEPNDDSRNFCRRCGHSLVEAEVVKTSWWRKLVTRKRRTVAAGERPGRPGRDGASGREAMRTARHGWRRVLSIRGKLRAILGFLAILGLASVTIGPMNGVGQDAWERVRRVIKPSYEPVRPVAATASSSAPGRDPAWLIDGIRNSFWADGVDGPGIGESITITFAEPTDIDRIGITPGATETPEQFIAQPRPRELHIVFEGDEVRSNDITVADSSEFQDFDVGGGGVTRVVIEIRSAHLGTEGHDLAIAELEFYVKE